jgi:Bacterial regulatory proteins, tetR family.
MGKRRIDRDKIVYSFLASAFDKSAGATSLADVAALLDVNKASLYNHFESRDEIYEATLDFCAEYMGNVRFIPGSMDTLLELTPVDALAKIIRQYFRSYEMEPLFQMYTFVHSNQFFTERAAVIAACEKQKIAGGITDLAVNFSAAGKLNLHLLKDTQRHAAFFATALSEQLNTYITNKKETVRRNPESGTGSLFALPPDDRALNDILEQDILYWNSFTK